MKVVINNINVSISKNQNKELENEVLKRGIKKDNIEKIEYIKRSIDSRKKSDIKFVYNIEITLKKEINIENLDVNLSKKIEKLNFKKIEGIERVAIIGSGPAGLFSALRLCELGIKPVIYERGEKVENRDKTINHFVNFSILNENSNIQFGEGGA
ncbi:FAD-dependent monooxygenase, partial [uncultured Cetobacterium sp.]|uniref:FAD-dependent monooxygenase n=1 Tax=uncultured Cetobacterium sp. TaxID=527638 RepID=UPI002637C15A